jgi:hypothetical protein
MMNDVVEGRASRAPSISAADGDARLSNNKLVS